MGEKDSKISEIVLKVDLECQRCYKKIRKVLCKIQDQMKIKKISFNEKSNSVTISGPFDAERVCKKLCCKAGRVIKEMNIKGKESKNSDDKAAVKPIDKDNKEATSEEKEGKTDKESKGEKDGKTDKEAKLEKKDAKAEKEAKPNKEKDAKPEKKVRFEDDGAKPKADIGPLLEKMPTTSAMPATQGFAVHSIWPTPASSLAGYRYNPSYDPSNYGGGCYSYGCGCGYGGGDCRCGKFAKPAGGYYGVPVYDNHGWYYGGRQPYYPQQQSYYEDPNVGCSVM